MRKERGVPRLRADRNDRQRQRAQRRCSLGHISGLGAVAAGCRDRAVVRIPGVARNPSIRPWSGRSKGRGSVVARPRDRHARGRGRGRRAAVVAARPVDKERDRARRVRAAAQVGDVIDRRARRRRRGWRGSRAEIGRRGRRHGRNDDLLAGVAAARRRRIVVVIAGVRRDPPVGSDRDRRERPRVVGAVPRDNSARGARRGAGAGRVSAPYTLNVIVPVRCEPPLTGALSLIGFPSTVAADATVSIVGCAGAITTDSLGITTAGRAGRLIVGIPGIAHAPPIGPREGRGERIGVVDAVAVET